MALTDSSYSTLLPARPNLSAETAILISVLVFVTMVIAATALWGLPALAMIAVASVPFVIVTLVLITVGK